MRAAVSEAAWPHGYGRRVLAELGSTMEEAARIAPGLGGPEWVLGLRQTKGRGRRGRPWADPGGNFSATLVLWPEGDAGQVALRSFVAALALHEACVEVTGQAERFTLKWPNDVLLNGGKLAGILLERAAMPGARAPLLIGIGVNLAACPPVDAVEPGGLRPVSLKAETGVEIAPEAFLAPLARAFAKWEAQFATHGFAPIRRAWLSHAARLGEEITARTGTATHHGRFETVDEAGHLVLSTAQSRIAIPAADVFF